MEARIRTVYDEHKGRYGYRRITAALVSFVRAAVRMSCSGISARIPAVGSFIPSWC
ncbi:IS3 family transposase [Diaphorobacter sp. HDW4A]|uniref:IS3 family transposase n=1 Tax=Diaphorobacter sp. HDW4A TaxID=2714924 RepID=UPI00352FF075